MAEAEKKPSGPGPMGDLLLFVGFVVILVVLWFNSGGDKRADIRGIFIHPPAPIDQGGSYGPHIGTTTISNVTK
jgi:hypothetical protein